MWRDGQPPILVYFCQYSTEAITVSPSNKLQLNNTDNKFQGRKKKIEGIRMNAPYRKYRIIFLII